MGQSGGRVIVGAEGAPCPRCGRYDPLRLVDCVCARCSDEIDPSVLSREDVVERFCKLSSKVAEEVFGHRFAADCFCGRGGLPENWGWRYEDDVLAWIERVVLAAVEGDHAR